jgi:phosphoribosylamine--glycine ligase
VSAPRTVLVVGSGGREHALVRALSRSDGVSRVIAVPGNPGIAAVAEAHALAASDHPAVVALARRAGVELAVIGPEAPLVEGLADALRAGGVPTLGPTREAARLEGSKAFAKEVMSASGVPTARSRTVADMRSGLAAVRELGLPVAVKADGLAAGKGVVVAVTEDGAREALEACLVTGAFGAAGRVVVVEEGMSGPEVSLIAVCDGERVARLPAARDYKPIGEGNTGPNTGGMGSVSPVPDVPDALADELVDAVHRPVVAEMARRGTPFAGVLYAGLMLTPDGPRVLEFNVRFGDPETQALLPRLGPSLAERLLHAAEGRLDDVPIQVTGPACVAVVLAAGGYPAAPRTGDEITGVDAAEATGAAVYHAGTALTADGRLVTAGGRVLAVSAPGAGVPSARAAAYSAAAHVRFEGRQMRSDIAAGVGAA